MRELARVLSDQEKESVAKVLEKLYAFQDRSLDAKKKAMIVMTLNETSYPYKAIIEGIKDLFNVELKSIKMSAIINSVKARIFLEPEKNECLLCHQGWVHMDRDDGYNFAVPCKCTSGVRVATFHKIKRWNGFRRQNINKHVYTLNDSKAERGVVGEFEDDSVIRRDPETDFACELVNGSVVNNHDKIR